VEVLIRKLEPSDERDRFDCGVASLNDWLRKFAAQHEKKNLTRTYVAIVSNMPNAIAGYYALAATSIETDGVPGKARLPRKVSAILLARLAVEAQHRGKGLGELLLAHALDTVVRTAQAIGVQCVVVDAIDDNAANFYRKYGFQSLTHIPLRLMLPVATIMQA
jgi:GNAT superfamily N-acetyltransferase